MGWEEGRRVSERSWRDAHQSAQRVWLGHARLSSRRRRPGGFHPPQKPAPSPCVIFKFQTSFSDLCKLPRGLNTNDEWHKQLFSTDGASGVSPPRLPSGSIILQAALIRCGLPLNFSAPASVSELNHGSSSSLRISFSLNHWRRCAEDLVRAAGGVYGVSEGLDAAPRLVDYFSYDACLFVLGC
jgi:hypothetical protein